MGNGFWSPSEKKKKAAVGKINGLTQVHQQQLRMLLLRYVFVIHSLHLVMFRPGLAQKPQLWLGPRRLWLSRNLGRAKAPTDGLALARLGPSPGFWQRKCIFWHDTIAVYGTTRSLNFFSLRSRSRVRVACSAAALRFLISPGSLLSAMRRFLAETWRR